MTAQVAVAVLPVWSLPGWAAAVANVVAAVGASVAAGYWAHRLPASRLAQDGRLLRLRAFERGGRWYERRLRIRRWKHAVPEAGAWLPGGVSKRRLLASDAAGLERFAAETRRAERTHWAAMAVGPIATLWNPPIGALVMLAYALGVNLPCIAIQRYNRARVERVLSRSESSTSRLSG